MRKPIIWVKGADSVSAQQGCWKAPFVHDAPLPNRLETVYVHNDLYAKAIGALRDIRDILARSTIMNVPTNRAYVRASATLSELVTLTAPPERAPAQELSGNDAPGQCQLCGGPVQASAICHIDDCPHQEVPSP